MWGIIVINTAIQQKTLQFLPITTVPISTLEQIHTLKCRFSFCWLSICDNRTQVTKDCHLLRFWKRVDIFLVICVRVWFFMLVFRDNPLPSCLHCTGGVHTSGCVCVCVCVWGGRGSLQVFSHICQGVVNYTCMTVLCRNICDRDQNWIKWTKPFFESWSRDQGSPQTAKIKESRTCSSNLTFDL